MESNAQILGLELIVEDIDRATALFVDVLGFELQQRGPFELFVGEIAIVTDGRIAVTLLQPADHGPGSVLPRREPRVSQLVFGVEGEQTTATRALAAESGIPTLPFGDGGFYVTPNGGEGLLGFEIAAVVLPVVAGQPD